MILPYSGTSEPVRVYYDLLNNRSRTGEEREGAGRRREGWSIMGLVSPSPSFLFLIHPSLLPTEYYDGQDVTIFRPDIFSFGSQYIVRG